MSSSNFATSFAPYAPPPDDPQVTQNTESSSSFTSRIRPWFPPHTSSLGYDTSYQSGGIPTFGTSESGGLAAAEQAEGRVNQWETQYGARVDMLAAWAYVVGPISALALLIIETKNDYIRFHSYQSALLTAPLTILWILASLLQFPQWVRTFLLLTFVVPAACMAFRAHRDANRNNLFRYQLPWIGPLAERWVDEE